MNTRLVQKVRHALLVLAIAVLVALSAGALPAVVDQVTGSSLTPHAYACEVPTGGC